jgi:ABC-type multidrug transport system ATPase subunit
MGVFLKAEGLVKDYGHIRALKGVNLEVRHGESLVLLGPNGAGKSTLLGILAGRIHPNEGKAAIGGSEIGSSSNVRRLIGYLNHASLLYPGLTAMENLLFFGRLYMVEDLRGRAEEMLRLMGLWERRNDRVGGYSRGMEQRLSIARALLHEPQLLLLDEPFSGLDHQSARAFAKTLLALKDGHRSLIVATHDMNAASSFGDRVLILEKGRILYGGQVPPDVRILYTDLIQREWA